ncbi:MAG TPA: hypothetical protein VHA56_15010 [Mucilaginibacter sp.]|nr:hypothetical protein [Mucilaginibacter sp.]
MKFCPFLFVLLFAACLCSAQDTVNRRNKLLNSVVEKYKIIKGDNDTRVGAYKAFYRRRTIIAEGNYDKGKKAGVWSFYDKDGTLSEKYDYDKSEFLYESAIDSTSDVHFGFDADVNPGDRLTRPVRIGGAFYGFIPYLHAFRLPFETDGLDVDYIDAVVELLISPGGRLADYKIHLLSDYYDYKQSFNFDTSLFSEEDKKFAPATLNHRPILSRIFIRCSVNNNGSLDFY